MRTTTKELHLISFPDFSVQSFELDEVERKALLELDGAFIDSGGGRALGPGVLCIEAWRSVTISEFADARWRPVSHDEAHGLKEICEFEAGKSLVLRGFGVQSGQWTEYRFEGARGEWREKPE